MIRPPARSAIRGFIPGVTIKDMRVRILIAAGTRRGQHRLNRRLARRGRVSAAAGEVGDGGGVGVLGAGAAWEVALGRTFGAGAGREVRVAVGVQSGA